VFLLKGLYKLQVCYILSAFFPGLALLPIPNLLSESLSTPLHTLTLSRPVSLMKMTVIHSRLLDIKDIIPQLTIAEKIALLSGKLKTVTPFDFYLHETSNTLQVSISGTQLLFHAFISPQSACPTAQMVFVEPNSSMAFQPPAFLVAQL